MFGQHVGNDLASFWRHRGIVFGHFDNILIFTQPRREQSRRELFCGGSYVWCLLSTFRKSNGQHYSWVLYVVGRTLERSYSTITQLRGAIIQLRAAITQLRAATIQLRVAIIRSKAAITQLRVAMIQLRPVISQLKLAIKRLRADIIQLRAAITQLKATIIQLRITTIELWVAINTP